jgi:nicotinate dehydrogenase subunit B
VRPDPAILCERVRYDRTGALSRDWTDYPVLRFDQVPAPRTFVLQRPGAQPPRVGEASMPPIAAAVANALNGAIGVRMRQLPITPAAL